MNLSMYSRTVSNFIPCPKIFLINTLCIDNVNTQMHTLKHMILVHYHAMCRDYLNSKFFHFCSQMKGMLLYMFKTNL